VRLNDGASAETNRVCACSVGVGYERSDITLIVAAPINPATTVQGMHIQGQLVSPKPHMVAVPGVDTMPMHCKKKLLWKMLVYCFFGEMDLLGRTTGDSK